MALSLSIKQRCGWNWLAQILGFLISSENGDGGMRLIWVIVHHGIGIGRDGMGFFLETEESGMERDEGKVFQNVTFIRLRV